MFTLIAIIALVGLGIYYVTTLDFEVGDGFTEVSGKAKKVKHTVVEPEKIEGETE